jgi:hypothetical protein
MHFAVARVSAVRLHEIGRYRMPSSERSIPAPRAQQSFVGPRVGPPEHFP